MTKFDKQFKVDAVQYYHDHRDLGLIGCAHNLGIFQQTLSRWQKQLRDNGEMPYRGSGYVFSKNHCLEFIPEVGCIWHY